MISFEVSGSGPKTEQTLQRMLDINVLSILEAQAIQGMNALESATPYDSGIAAHSWGYEIHASGGWYRISWTNSDIENGFPVVIMLQYGHGTGTGGWVQGRDFINPAIRPIFDQIADTVWKAVTSV
jgi:hypothetical protein